MTDNRPKILTESFVASIAEPGRYGDGQGGFGLSILVKTSSNSRWSKSWSQRIRINGEAKNLGLGSFPVVSLAMARERAFDNARKVALGYDVRQLKPTIPHVPMPNTTTPTPTRKQKRRIIREIANADRG